MLEVTSKMKPSLALSVALSLALGCIRPPLTPTSVPPGPAAALSSYSSPKYGDPKMWLCRPDDPNDACHQDISATEIRADGSRVVLRHEAAAAPSVDCFYVYPTVDLDARWGNHASFADTSAMALVARAQIARFSEVCRVYAPLYRQITFGTYLSSPEIREAYAATAFSDVADAFLHYLAQWNRGRPLVVVGHSQGGEMVVRLLQKYFDSSPEMRSRLLLGMPIGWDVEVVPGTLVGGSFKNIPVCSLPDEKGCVITFHSHSAVGDKVKRTYLPRRPGFAAACVNPANLGSKGFTRFSRAYFPTLMRDFGLMDAPSDVETPFILYRGFFSGRCVAGDDGYQFLEVAWSPENGDPRGAPLDLEDDWNSELGLHILDMQFAQGDLIDLVRRGAPRQGNERRVEKLEIQPQAGSDRVVVSRP